MKHNGEKRWGWVPHLLRIIGLMIGAGILFYPTISSQWNKYRDSRLISEYSHKGDSYSEDQYKEVWDSANVMGYIEIPKIDIRLPIYHGVGTEALEKGAGHIEGTSLPIGGPGTHAVLSGHRGLPGRKLFTDLDLIKVGDQFYVQVLNETLAYEVDQILTVLPQESQALSIVPGEDLVTLVTCTPYGVNTHRLLIRGHRIPYEENSKKEQKRDVVEKVKNAGIEEKLVMIGLAVFFALCILFWIISEVVRRNKKKESVAEKQIDSL